MILKIDAKTLAKIFFQKAKEIHGVKNNIDPKFYF